MLGTRFGNVASSGAGAFVANAVNFDGTNTFLEKSTNLSNVADGKQITISLWVNPANVSDSEFLFFFGETGVNSRYQLHFTSNGTIFLDISGDAGQIASWESSVSISTSSWSHILISIDATTESGSLIYINDIEDTEPFNLFADRSITFTNVPDNRIGADNQGTPTAAKLFDGDMAEVWIDNSYLDLSIESNRRKFISSNIKPVGLNTDGSAPTGSTPMVYLSGDTDSWHTNKGDGGGFAENGTLTDSSTSPSD